MISLDTGHDVFQNQPTHKRIEIGRGMLFCDRLSWHAQPRHEIDIPTRVRLVLLLNV